MEPTNVRFERVHRIGGHRKWTQDLYHTLLTTRWSTFFLFYVCFFLLFNAIFGFCYWIFPNALAGTDHSFWQSFLFSVQTFSTVGYGIFHPNSDWAHAFVVLESILSVFVTAVLTGLVFSKFSRPTARVLFSKNILINNFEGKRMLSLRIGNLRANQIAEAQVHMVALISIKTIEGQQIRRQIDLNLVRSSSLYFALTWSVMHMIDEKSPLYNMTSKDLIDKDIEIVVSVIGNDSTFSQTVHANAIYQPEDIIFDRYFEDVVEMQGDKVKAIHYEKFHDLQK